MSKEQAKTFEIKNRWDGTVIYASDEVNSVKELVEKAVKERVDLFGADLTKTDLTKTDLTKTNLTKTDLRYAIGNNDQVKSLQIGTYLVTYFKSHSSVTINIGCQSHKMEAWAGFTDQEISAMDSQALKWWQDNRDIILTLAGRELS